ncbi:MAG: STT3 domain-containing protein [Candidatus Altiarchaeota archaeon]
MGKRKRVIEQVVDSTPVMAKKPGIEEHLQEPMFLTAIAGFIVTLLMFYKGMGFMIDNAPILLGVLLLASLYFLNAHLKAKTKNNLLYGIPVLLFTTLWFSIMLTRNLQVGLGRDYLIFTTISGVFLFFYALASHRIIKLSSAFMLALFFSTLLTHFIPAMDIYLAEIDPHWHYKWAQLVAKDGHLPDYDNLTYPMKGGIKYYGKGIPGNFAFGLEDYYNATSNTYSAGLDLSRNGFFAALFMGSMYTALKPMGFSIEDSAMLYPLVIGAFAIIVFYLLLRYMFEDFKPYNEFAAFIGAFMLFMSPIFATKAAAGNCEDDIMGMFLLLASLMFLILAFRRRSLINSIIGGFSLLALRIAWGGYNYEILVMGLSMGLYAITSFLKNEYCVRMPPYALLMYSMSQMYVLFLHRQGGGMDVPTIGMGFVTLSFFGSIVLSVILEFIRVDKYGQLAFPEEGFFSKIDGIIEKNIKPIGLAAIFFSLAAFIFIGPSSVINELIGSVTVARVDDVVGKTIAEQNPMAYDFWGFLSDGYLRYGVALIYGMCMIPLLIYLAYEKNSFGSAFVLSWSIPMMWGVYNKSQLLFNSSAPIAALGATVGLYAVSEKKELNSLRIISVILIILVPLLYLPFLGGSSYSKFVGFRTLYVVMTEEMYFWNPSLEWLSNHTQPTEAVITWWDYGHWITSISHRPVLIDNLQVDGYEIQDVAQFFMLKRDQEDSMNTIRAYNNRYKEMGMNLSHVAIDWTMIGKGSALHFIATGVIENKTEGSGMNFATCIFLETQSSQQKVITDKDGKPVLARQLIFGCQWPIAGISFEIVGEEINSIKAIVADSSGNTYFIPWETWVKDNHDSILGVQPLSDILVLGLQRPDILGDTNAKWRDNNSVLYSAQTYQLIYVPGEFNDYMMTRLYLGDHVDDVPAPECLSEANKKKVVCANYLNSGLFTGNISSFKPKYFKLVGDFSGSYVRVYEIGYEGFGNETKSS